MGRKAILFLTLVLIIGLFVNEAGAVPVIIGFKDEADPELVRQQQGKISHVYKYIPAVAANLSEKAIKKLSKNPKVAHIEPDYEVRILEQTVPWGIARIGAPLVHASGNMGTEINVAVIDTGINYNHADLDDNYIDGYDFVNEDDDPIDDNGHGTHCAGIIAAEDNDEGVIGVAPEANLYALKVLDKNGMGYESDIIAAIEWAIDNNIQIISMSLGSDQSSDAEKQICDRAYQAGIILVAAAGNDGNPKGVGDNVDYPARYSSVVAVAAIDSSNERASYSSTGPDVELAAPGVNIYSTYLDGYDTMSGTSMACPHVAGAAALFRAEYPELTNDELRTRLNENAEDLGVSGWDPLYGFGLVNADKAVEAVPLEMHVEDITMRTDTKNIRTKAIAVINIIDAEGKPVDGANVEGNWTLNKETLGTISGLTEAGIVELDSPWVKKANGTFTFTVDNIQKNEWEYNETANKETSGSITV